MFVWFSLDYVVFDFQKTDRLVGAINVNLQSGTDEGIIVGQVAGVPVTFLIDSGAEVNTIGGDVFKLLVGGQSSQDLFCVTNGTDKPLKAYASSCEIPVIATFVAELFISSDRPKLLEKFYAVENARALLSRNTAIRYSLLQIGLNVPILEANLDPCLPKLMPGEIGDLSASQ